MRPSVVYVRVAEWYKLGGRSIHHRSIPTIHHMDSSSQKLLYTVVIVFSISFGIVYDMYHHYQHLRSATQRKLVSWSALCCRGPVDLEFAARQSSWLRTESRHFKGQLKTYFFAKYSRQNVFKTLKLFWVCAISIYTSLTLPTLMQYLVEKQSKPGRGRNQSCERQVVSETDGLSCRLQRAERGLPGAAWCGISATRAL